MNATAQAALRIERVWEMPNHDTFSIRVIRRLLDRVLADRECVVDPFARNSKVAHLTNDIDAGTGAMYHMDAVEFCDMLMEQQVKADALLFDPPYSPRQMSEAYKNAGRKVGMKETQNATLYAAVKDRLTQVALPGAVAVSFGWNSTGFGVKRGWQLEEVWLVCHGGAHNDTIVTVERRTR